MRAYLVPLCFLLGLSACSQPPSLAEDRHVSVTEYLDGSMRIVVAEAELEPRSIGSYSVRLYSGRERNILFDNYVSGLVLRRGGVIEQVVIGNVDTDFALEAVISIRSVGTGSYLSADIVELRPGALVYEGQVLLSPESTDLLAAARAQLQ